MNDWVVDLCKWFTPVEKESPLYWYSTRWAHNFLSDINQLLKRIDHSRGYKNWNSSTGISKTQLQICCELDLFTLAFYNPLLQSVAKMEIAEFSDKTSSYLFSSDWVTLDGRPRYWTCTLIDEQGNELQQYLNTVGQDIHEKEDKPNVGASGLAPRAVVNKEKEKERAKKKYSK